MSVARVRTEVDSREYEGWLALYTRTPFGFLADQHQRALIGAQLVNIQCKGSPFKPTDFMPPSIDEDAGEHTEESSKAVAMAIAAKAGIPGPRKPCRSSTD